MNDTPEHRLYIERIVTWPLNCLYCRDTIRRLCYRHVICFDLQISVVFSKMDKTLIISTTADQTVPRVENVAPTQCYFSRGDIGNEKSSYDP